MLYRLLDLGFPLTRVRMTYVSKAPEPVLAFGNISKPFPPAVWFCICSLLLAFALLFLITYKAYEKTSISFIRKEVSHLNFALFAFSKITEPDPLPWFRSGISSSLSLLLWSLLCLFSTMFYLSNLRAVMVAVEYGDYIDTLQDVLDNNERVWISASVISHRYKAQTNYSFF